jgi:ketosteroid isomerase-like protein
VKATEGKGTRAMGEQENRQAVEQVHQLMEKQDWDGVIDFFHDDVTQEWPQSGEKLRGKENCLAVFRNYPGGIPSMSVERVVASGDLATVEATIHYSDGSTYQGVSIFEFRDGKIAKETDYFAQPFEAPSWRAQWVERT